MIVLKRNRIYKLVINANSISIADRLLLTQFNNYQGKIPFGMISNVGHTITIDLTQSEENILQDCKSNTRNEIRRAIREDFFFEEVKSYDEFVSFYNSFAEEKGIDKISNEHLTQYGDSIVLFKSGKNGITMTMHASAIDKDSHVAILLYSSSVRFSEDVDKKEIGFSNRFLHYKEFVEFKKRGIQLYDFNGICIDQNDKERYSISQFKAAFGGRQVDVLWIMSYPYFLISKIKKFFT